jgi:hypothetical protein
MIILKGVSTPSLPGSLAWLRYQDRGLPFCYVGYFDGMEEGILRANIIEAKINNVSVRYERPRAGETDNEIYSQGEVVPADKIVNAAGFKVRRAVDG